MVRARCLRARMRALGSRAVAALAWHVVWQSVVTPASTASDLQTPTQAAVVARDQLFVAMSCVNPLDAPSRHAIEGLDEVRIGRGPARDVVRGADGGRRTLSLGLVDRHVSSEHARL